MTSNSDESPDSPNRPSPARPSSASSCDWLLVTARILFVIAFVPIGMMAYEGFDLSEATDIEGLMLRIYIYSGTAVGLGTVSAVLFAIRRCKLLRKGGRVPPISFWPVD